MKTLYHYNTDNQSIWPNPDGRCSNLYLVTLDDSVKLNEEYERYISDYTITAPSENVEFCYMIFADQGEPVECVHYKNGVEQSLENAFESRLLLRHYSAEEALEIVKERFENFNEELIKAAFLEFSRHYKYAENRK